MKFSAYDLNHLEVAQGFLELNMFLDADSELDKIDAQMQHDRKVLELRQMIYFGLGKWELMEASGLRLCKLNPDNGEYAYALAVAQCQQGKLEEARQNINRAFTLKETLRLEAVGDEGLKPIWDSI